MDLVRNGVCKVQSVVIEPNSEVRFVISALNESLKNKNWSDLSKSLQKISKLAEQCGQPQICLRAQGIRELLGFRAGGRDQLGERIEMMLTDLKSKLTHWDWQTQKIETRQELF